MRLRTLALAILVSMPPVAFAQAAPEAKRGPALTRISYWTTRPGKDAEARAFWKQFAPVFDEMKKKGLILEYQFLSPALHTGQDWTIAYIWVCPDMTAYGQADAYFSDAVGKMDGQKISADFEAAFDGSKHRDELWRSLDIR